MGKTFDLISENAIEKLGKPYEECQVCGMSDIDLFQYHGTLTLEDGSKDDDIYAVCYNCIQSKPLNHICDFEYIKTITQYLDQQTLGPEKEKIRTEIILKYQQTPDIPTFIQQTDRPLCCNNITEFKGHPKNDEELFQISENNCYWEKHILEKSEYYDFRKYGTPESYNYISEFKCKKCDKKYFTFQFS